jgi:esterase/lipase superfamily enzyme
MRCSILFFVAGLAVLAACTPRGAFTPVPADSKDLTYESMFVGTTRQADVGGFGFARADDLSFARFDISIPPNREKGDLNWPPSSRKPDPDRDFLTARSVVFDSPGAFRQSLASEMAKDGRKSLVVYVHGFNTNMAEGVYRFAQLHHDLNVPAVAVHYAWPSRGSALGYLQDRDSSLFATRGFHAFLDEAVSAGASEIVIVAHSMGAALATETLRQIALSNDKRVMGSLRGIVLISPDIDVDVFRSQAADIGRLPQPFVIFGSSGDQILNISARVSGAPERLGNLSDITPLADLDVTYLDTTKFNVGAGHMNLASSPALLSLFSGVSSMDQAFSQDERSRVGLLPGIVLTVRNATEVVLAPVVAIDEELDDYADRP